MGENFCCCQRWLSDRLKAGIPGLEPRTTVPETAVLPITPYPKELPGSPPLTSSQKVNKKHNSTPNNTLHSTRTLIGGTQACPSGIYATPIGASLSHGSSTLAQQRGYILLQLSTHTSAAFTGIAERFQPLPCNPLNSAAVDTASSHSSTRPSPKSLTLMALRH